VKKTLTPKERVLTAFARQEPDRVPIDYSANADIDRRLKAHFGLQADDHEGLLQALGVDFRYPWPRYTGQKLHDDLPGVHVDDWGIHRRWVEHEAGGYWDYCDWPLRDATVEQVAAWPMPSPDDYDYAGLVEECRRFSRYALNGSGGFGDIINGNGMLRTMEQTLVDLVTNDPAGMLLADRRMEIQIGIAERVLDAANGLIDFMYLGEDLGTQIGPMISMKTFRQQIRPRYEKYVALARAYNLPVMMHCCGSSSWAFDEFIDLGIAVVDTLQPEAKNMAPAYLKQRYGDRMAFHGCISTAGPVAYGTVAEITAYCEQTLETMMPGGGYCFAPTHALQDNSPTENVIAMYEVAHTRGCY
jgi:uroporphyrinogen decarboxylase